MTQALNHNSESITMESRNDAFKDLMKQKGLNVPRTAEVCGIPVATLYNYTRSPTSMSYRVMPRLTFEYIKIKLSETQKS
jgi:hypothetical protein